MNALYELLILSLPIFGIISQANSYDDKSKSRNHLIYMIVVLCLKSIIAISALSFIVTDVLTGMIKAVKLRGKNKNK